MDIFEIQSALDSTMRLAWDSDLEFLTGLEERCFEPFRRFSRSSIQNSIRSKWQQVIILEEDGVPQGSMILRQYQSSIRVMSLAVLPQSRGRHYGRKLMLAALTAAKINQVANVILEVDFNDDELIMWYESFGFEKSAVLDNYYGRNMHGLKMILKLNPHVKYIVVTDYACDLFDHLDMVVHVRATDYISDSQYHNMKDLKVFNLCTSYKYQSVGYYVSLLAVARNQVAYPSVSLIRDLHNASVIKSIGDEIHQNIQNALADVDDDFLVIESYFSIASDSKFQSLISAMSNLFNSPFVQFEFARKKTWYLKKVRLLKLAEVKDKVNVPELASAYFSGYRFVTSSLKSYDYDMAILIDENEKLPPSDKAALEKFKSAAERKGFFVEFITKKDYARLPEYDALFIRTTTSVNDYTYEFSRYAYAEGLVVIDDPWSILRCANKLYLYEALRNGKVKMPKTWVLNKKRDYEKIIGTLPYPVVLKLPDSAFSAGVYKVTDKEACEVRLKEMFKRSELIIAQAFMPTEFDWRIGIIDRKVIYACKYYMAKEHWQIVNWGQDEAYEEGAYKSIPLSQVPRFILSAAKRSGNIIGDGLYGIDIKEVGGEGVVIEVNDNPSLEYGVEDGIDGDGLYEKIMDVFYDRLENNRKVLRRIH